MSTITRVCPDCGAIIPEGLEDCQAIWYELSIIAQLPEVAFDAYCMQHLDRYCRSAKSYAAHLTRLCAGIEFKTDPRCYPAIQFWLDGPSPVKKPALLTFLGDMTIAAVYAAPATDRARFAHLWAENVWAAYRTQHDLARSWIHQALKHTG